MTGCSHHTELDGFLLNFFKTTGEYSSTGGFVSDFSFHLQRFVWLWKDGTNAFNIALSGHLPKITTELEYLSVTDRLQNAMSTDS